MDRYQRRRGLYEEQQRGQEFENTQGQGNLEDIGRQLQQMQAYIQQSDQQIEELDQQQALLELEIAAIDQQMAELGMQEPAPQEPAPQEPAQPTGPQVGGGAAPPMREVDRLKAEHKWYPGSPEFGEYEQHMKRRAPRTKSGGRLLY